MGSHHASRGILRWLVAAGGLLGLLLAVDGFVAFLFVVLSVLLGSGPPNPYVGAIAYGLLPILILIGLATAYAAYRFWTATSQPAAQRSVVMR